MALSEREKTVLSTIKALYSDEKTNTAFIENELGIYPEIDILDDTPVATYVLRHIHARYQGGDDMSAIEKLVGVEEELPKELKKALGEFGDTPDKEPDIAMLGDGEDVRMVFYDAKEKIEERVQLDGFDKKVAAEFIKQVLKRVNSHTDEDGLKRTKLLEEIGFLTKAEATAILKISSETVKIGGKSVNKIELLNYFSNDSDDREAAAIEGEKFQAKVIKSLKRAPKNLSDWDKSHLFLYVMGQITEDMNTFAGVFS